jgi:hypothetical protein
MQGNRVSLPRAGLGALLAGTLLAGSLLGAAVYAGVSMAAAHAGASAIALPRESTTVRDARVVAGNGQLAGDARGGALAVRTAGIPAAVRNGQLGAGNGPLAADVRGVPTGTVGAPGVTRTNDFPTGRDGFGFAGSTGGASGVIFPHAPGRGQLP